MAAKSTEPLLRAQRRNIEVFFLISIRWYHDIPAFRGSSLSKGAELWLNVFDASAYEVHVAIDGRSRCLS